MGRFRPRLTFANVTSMFALFVALGSGAYAATQLPANSVGTPQLKQGAVTSLKIKDGTIIGADVNKAKLGKVPLAAQADNSAKLGALTPIAFLRSNGKAVDAAHADNASLLNNLASTDFLRSNGKAVDAAHADSADNAVALEGNPAAAFLGATAKAADADKLDGRDSAEFARSNLNSNTPLRWDVQIIATGFTGTQYRFGQQLIIENAGTTGAPAMKVCVQGNTNQAQTYPLTTIIGGARTIDTVSPSGIGVACTASKAVAPANEFQVFGTGVVVIASPGDSPTSNVHQAVGFMT